MKNELLKILGIVPVDTDTDAQVECAIVAAVQTLAGNADAAKATLDEESTVNKMIADSHGSLTPASARQVLKNRAAYAASVPKPIEPAAKKTAKK